MMLIGLLILEIKTADMTNWSTNALESPQSNDAPTIDECREFWKFF